MKLIDDENGHAALRVDDHVVDALQALGKTLTAAGLSARITLTSVDGSAAIQVMLGRDSRGGSHVLHARPSAGPGSRLGIDETEGY
jgi:hypothetical protein